MPMDYKQVQALIKDFEMSNLSSLELDFDGVKLKLTKLPSLSPAVALTPAVAPTVPVTPLVNSAKKNESPALGEPASPLLAIKSPLVGTFYAASSPNSEPFVSVGKKVKKGQTVCIIEAMKIMNEIASPYDGVIEKIELKSGSVVGFDQVLMTVNPGV